MNAPVIPNPKPDDRPTAATSEHCPQRPYFDAESGTWVLSRYGDVQAAFYEVNLCPVSSHPEGQVTAETRTLLARTRSQTLAAMSAAKVSEWQSEFAPLAHEMASALPVSRPVNVYGEFAQPWSLALALRVTGADPKDAERLVALAATVSMATADPENADQSSSEAADAQLNSELKSDAQPMAGPAFVALSQTLPALLGNAWFLLLGQPDELDRLRENPDMLPRAVEELLRMGGVAHVLHRQAIADMQLGDLQIKAGQRVRLLLDPVHRDPVHFPEPDRLDVSRRASSQFALGAGSHSCAAAALLRMALGAATAAFAEHFTATDSASPVEWHGGSGFRWPAPLYAQRRSR
jgi:cytochrome P450